MRKGFIVYKSDVYIITTELDKYCKKTCAYFNKKHCTIKSTFSYRFLVADDYIILYPHFDVYSTQGTLSIQEGTNIRAAMFDNLLDIMPSKIEISDRWFTVLVLRGILPSSVGIDHMLYILSNAYHIIIATSTKKALDILDTSSKSDTSELANYIKRQAVWWLREDDGPPLVTDEDDCYIYEYILSIVEFM